MPYTRASIHGDLTKLRSGASGLGNPACGLSITLPVNDALTTDQISHLIDAATDRPGDDPIFSLNSEAKARAAAGEDILNATIGALMEDDGRLCVMPAVFTAYASVPPTKAAAYAPIAGDPPFLRAVIEDTFGAPTSKPGTLSAHSVAVATAGGTGALHHAIVNFLDPGQALLTTEYFWTPYKIIANHTRRAVETFEMFDESGRFNLKAFEESLTWSISRQGRALVIFNFPCHNPTGYSLDDEEWAGVANIVREAGRQAPVAFLNDLAYARYGREGSESWIQHLDTMAETAVVLVAWSASKTFAQYGARIGALVALANDADERERIANAISFSCRGTWSNCNHLGLLAITELLTNAELRQRVDAERAGLIRDLGARVEVFNREAEALGLVYPRYEGGFFVSLFTPDAELTAATMRAEGVYIVPMKGAVRVALCSTPTPAIPRLVAALKRGIDAAVDAARASGDTTSK
ncbi:MAG: aminotransferase class I/II-fold pyridoxal phosphate-dependent enzyme [Planctomycetota bacterium]|jgi:aromatic-amino-acid transaminase|nr:aminotransferase class I/II-fold pyridoxal phosphate-dependent enzyme [Planctomycetota bacterium]MDP6838880.1 aminotransferase class I/II-fold pyridoxal phosphate-dependent enzyme [Planctomycetota bacterium]MDP6955559.1 aminotransferase class I/II-fold pyridoxal phosphate-dependent enzyme [Planctomycetota bacterium]